MQGLFHLAVRVRTFILGVKGVVAAAAELVATLCAVEVHAASSGQCVRELALGAVNAVFLKVHGQALSLVLRVVGAFPVLEIFTAPPSVLLLPLPGGKAAVMEALPHALVCPVGPNYSHPVVPACSHHCCPPSS